MNANTAQRPIVAGKLKFESEAIAARAARLAPNRQTTRVFDVPVVVNEERCISGVPCLRGILSSRLPGHQHRKAEDLHEV